ncbi:MAG: hypothetical protein FWD47_14270 [Treponema sp.]|nr:hypothetical protein [Treponema sp.]
MIKICKSICFCFLTLFFSYCFLIFHNLKDVVEYEKEGTVSIDDKDLTIIYARYEPVDESIDGNAAQSGIRNTSLILKRLSGEQEEIVIFQEDISYINSLHLDKDNQLLFLIYVVLGEIRDSGFRSPNTCYLVVFDLNENQIISSSMLFKTKYFYHYSRSVRFLWPTQVNGGRYSVGFISNTIYDEQNKKIFFHIIYQFSRNPGLKSPYDDGYLSFNIETGILENISEDDYINYENNINSSKLLTFPRNPYFFDGYKNYRYESEDITREFFIISPGKNHGKYSGSSMLGNDGTYIYDGKNNILISEKHEYDFGGTPIAWLENGKYVVFGSYIFDTSGKFNELKISDESIRAIW